MENKLIKKIKSGMKKIGINLDLIPTKTLEKYESCITDIIDDNLEEILTKEEIEKIKFIYIFRGKFKINLWEGKE